MTNKPPEADCTPRFKAHQAAFAAYIRAPSTTPLPNDVKPERMAMYAQLMLNNVESFLSNTFPVCKKILSETQWLTLAQDFFANHASKSPYFSDIPEEFLQYLQEERQNPEDYPFLLELAHYEWVEMALAIAREEISLNSDCGDLMQQPLALSPLAWVLAYQYPVQQISPAYIPTSPPAEPTFLVVYRNAADEVKFMSINALTYRLLSLIHSNPQQAASDYLQQIAAELPQMDSQSIINGGRDILNDLATKHIIMLPIA